MKSLTKPDFNLCIEERLRILNKLRDKNATVMNKISEIYGDDNPVNGWKG